MTLFDSLGLLYRELRDYVRFYDLDASARSVVFYAEDTASHSYFEGLEPTPDVDHQDARRGWVPGHPVSGEILDSAGVNSYPLPLFV